MYFPWHVALRILFVLSFLFSKKTYRVKLDRRQSILLSSLWLIHQATMISFFSGFLWRMQGYWIIFELVFTIPFMYLTLRIMDAAYHDQNAKQEDHSS